MTLSVKVESLKKIVLGEDKAHNSTADLMTSLKDVNIAQMALQGLVKGKPEPSASGKTSAPLPGKETRVSGSVQDVANAAIERAKVKIKAAQGREAAGSR